MRISSDLDNSFGILAREGKFVLSGNHFQTMTDKILDVVNGLFCHDGFAGSDGEADAPYIISLFVLGDLPQLISNFFISKNHAFTDFKQPATLHLAKQLRSTVSLGPLHCRHAMHQPLEVYNMACLSAFFPKLFRK